MKGFTPGEIETLTASFLPEIEENWRYFHQHPELSFHEENTSEYIQNYLRKQGIPFQAGYAKHGILAWLEGQNPDSRIVALRADMDALPVQEFGANEVTSLCKGVMHACGHDAHMAIVLGVARVLASITDLFAGRVLFIFQPAEETLPGGAQQMIREGLFDKWRPDALLAQHVFPGFPTGTLACKPGNLMAATDEVFITIKAGGGHAAMPDTLVDTVLVASHVVVALQQIVSRNAPTWCNTVLSFGIIEGKGANNVIPAEVKLVGTLRTQDESWRRQAWEKIGKLATGVAESMGAGCNVRFEHGYPALNNDAVLASRVLELSQILPWMRQTLDAHAVMTSEDFAYFAQQIPSCMYFLGCSEPGVEHPAPLHSPNFRLDSQVLQMGVNTMAALVLDQLIETRTK